MQRVIPFLLSLCCLWGCHSAKQQKKEAPKPPKVQVGLVTTETIPVTIDAVGHFTAFNSAEIRAQVGGELLSIHFKEGSYVTKDQPLFSIDPRPYQAKRDAAVASRLRNEASLAYAQERVRRYESLATENYTSILDYLQYKTNVDMFEAVILQDDANIRYADIQLDFCSIRAPFSGIIGKKQIDIGNVIAQEGHTLVTLNQIDPIYIDFSIPERDFLRVQAEQRKHPLPVHINYLQEKNIQLTADLIMIDNQITSSNGMVPLRALLKNTEHTFWPGQFVRVSLLVTKIPNALMIPYSAVNQGQKGQYVFILTDEHTAKMQYITLGEHVGNRVQVLKGLAPGQKVITEGQINIANNTKVTVAS